MNPRDSHVSGSTASVIARVLAVVDKDRADQFAQWYAYQCIRYPNHLAPITWQDTVRTSFGAIMRARFQEALGRRLMLRRAHEPELTDRISQSLRCGDVFIDVGANIGYYSLLAAGIVGPDGAVFAFEPSHANLSDLTFNLSLNGVRNVIVLSTALSDSNGIGKLTLPWDGNSGVCSLGNGPSARGDDAFNAGFHLVSLSLFDDVHPANQIENRTGIVKIDAEGHEIQILRGMQRFLMRNRVAVACEISPASYLPSDLTDLMQSLGFHGEYWDGDRWQPIHPGRPLARLCNAWFERG